MNGAGAVNVALGGNGGGGGDAGAVIVRNTGDIRTAGGTPKNGGYDPKGAARNRRVSGNTGYPLRVSAAVAARAGSQAQ